MSNKLIEDFEEAVRAHEIKGTMVPEHWDAVDQRFQHTKTKLREALSPRDLLDELDRRVRKLEALKGLGLKP